MPASKPGYPTPAAGVPGTPPLKASQAIKPQGAQWSGRAGASLLPSSTCTLGANTRLAEVLRQGQPPLWPTLGDVAEKQALEARVAVGLGGAIHSRKRRGSPAPPQNTRKQD